MRRLLLRVLARRPAAHGFGEVAHLGRGGFDALPDLGEQLHDIVCATQMRRLYAPVHYEGLQDAQVSYKYHASLAKGVEMPI